MHAIWLWSLKAIAVAVIESVFNMFESQVLSARMAAVIGQEGGAREIKVFWCQYIWKKNFLLSQAGVHIYTINKHTHSLNLTLS